MELIRRANLVRHRDIAWFCRFSSAGREKWISAVSLCPPASNVRRLSPVGNADHLDDVDAFGASLGRFDLLLARQCPAGVLTTK